MKHRFCAACCCRLLWSKRLGWDRLLRLASSFFSRLVKSCQVLSQGVFLGVFQPKFLQHISDCLRCLRPWVLCRYLSRSLYCPASFLQSPGDSMGWTWTSHRAHVARKEIETTWDNHDIEWCSHVVYVDWSNVYRYIYIYAWLQLITIGYI